MEWLLLVLGRRGRSEEWRRVEGAMTYGRSLTIESFDFFKFGITACFRGFDFDYLARLYYKNIRSM